VRCGIRALLLPLFAAWRLAASPGCEPEPAKDSGISVTDARKQFDQANDLAEAKHIPQAIRTLKSIGWLPGPDRPDRDPELSNAIWLTLARLNYVSSPPQYCDAIQDFGYLLIDGYRNPDAAEDVEVTLKSWIASNDLNRDEFLRTTPVLLRLVSQQLGRERATGILVNVSMTARSESLFLALEEIALELFATGDWTAADFQRLEAPTIAKLLKSGNLKDKGAWPEICRAYGLNETCLTRAPLPDPTQTAIYKIYPTMAKGILPVYDSSPSLDHVLHPKFGPTTNSGRRVRLFSSLLARIAPGFSNQSPDQALYRWEAAFYLDSTNFDAAEAAASALTSLNDTFADKVVDSIRLQLPPEDDAFTYQNFFHKVLSYSNARAAQSPIVDLPVIEATLSSFARLKHQASADQLARVNRLRVEQPKRNEPDGAHGIYKPFESDQVLKGFLPAHHVSQALKVTIWNAVECAQEMAPPLWGHTQELVGYAGEDRYYAVLLNAPLEAGQCVQVSWRNSLAKDAGEQEVRDAELVHPDANGWARSRLYSRIGAQILSPALGRSLSAGLYGSLTYDIALRAETVPSGLQAGPRRGLPGLHWYLEGRIESLSVSVKVTDKNLGLVDDLGPRCGRRNTCAGPPTQAWTGETGIYSLWHIPHSSRFYQGSAVGLFLGPLVKVGTIGRGEQPPPGAIVHLAVENQPLAGEELRSGPFSYRSAGVRLTQFRYFSSRSTKGYFFGQTAPSLLLNVDFTYGHWQNFTLPPYQNFKTLPWRRELRVNFSVAPLPAFFGMFWNGGPGPDDFQFFVGVRYEWAQLAERIKRAHLRR
jgi:hypothetical protein